MTRNILSRDLIEEKTIPEPNSGCWLCYGSATKAGYGLFNVSGKLLFAHRASWEAFHGPIPVGKHVLHRCDVPACANPGHLFLGTQKTNAEDRERKGRGRQTKGERNGRAKLKVQDILAIRSSSEPNIVWARRLQIDRSVISEIRSRKIWKHVA